MPTLTSQEMDNIETSTYLYIVHVQSIAKLWKASYFKQVLNNYTG